MTQSKNPIIERHRGNAVVSTDPARLDMDVIHGFLSRAYWCEGIPREILERAIRNSICFGVYIDSVQVGFARVITDRATFAYLADVFILKSHRGRGLSKLLMEAIMSHPDLQDLRRFSLATRDAHGLYSQFGFNPPKMPGRLMEILDPDVYRRMGAASADELWATEGVKATSLPPRNILFVCIGNSCRSQMAEAFANDYGEGRVRAWSAGSAPLGWIAPDTYKVMEEKGISLDGQWSKSLKDVPVAEMDVVVGMGCEVSCPVPAGFKGQVVEWNIPDPFTAEIGRYREVRDLIDVQVRALLEEIQGNATSSNREAKNGV